MTTKTRAQSIREGFANLAPRPEYRDPTVVLPPPSGPRPVARGRRPKASKPVDEMGRYWPGRPERLVSVEHGDRDLLDAAAIETGYQPRPHRIAASYKPARPAPRGPLAILRVLERRGIQCIPTGDGEFAVIAEAGGLDFPTRDAIEAARPLLRAWLHHSPLRCALPSHVGGEPPEAVTLALGGAAWCGEC